MEENVTALACPPTSIVRNESEINKCDRVLGLQKLTFKIGNRVITTKRKTESKTPPPISHVFEKPSITRYNVSYVKDGLQMESMILSVRVYVSWVFLQQTSQYIRFLSQVLAVQMFVRPDSLQERQNSHGGHTPM